MELGLDNSVIRRYLALIASIINHKVLLPQSEFDNVASDDDVVETAMAFDYFIRNGKKQ